MFRDFYQQHKKIVFGVASTVLFIIVGLLYYRFFVFQLLSVDPPSGSTIASQARLVTFSFNKSLDTIDRERQVIVSDDAIISSFRTDESSILIQLKDLEISKQYKITLLNIRAEDGSEVEKIDYSFDYKYIPYNKLSKKEQQRQITATDRGNIDSPVIHALPVTTDRYYISYKLLEKPDAKGKQEKIIIALLLTNQDLDNIAKIKEYKKAALEFLKQNGINVSDYSVEYAPAAAAQY